MQYWNKGFDFGTLHGFGQRTVQGMALCVSVCLIATGFYCLNFKESDSVGTDFVMLLPVTLFKNKPYLEYFVL